MATLSSCPYVPAAHRDEWSLVVLVGWQVHSERDDAQLTSVMRHHTMPMTTLPTYDDLMNPLLEALRKLGGSGSIEEIYAKTVEITDWNQNGLIRNGK